MKALLIGTAVALGLSLTAAKASFVQLAAEDGDETKMFITKADDKDSSFVWGSVHGNGGNSKNDIGIQGTSLFTTGNGFANIKPAKDTILTSLIFTPVTPPNDLDGFFASVQLDWEGLLKNKDKDPQPGFGTFYITVNGSQTFTYTQDFSTNDHFNGFDEPGDASTESLITSVKLWTDVAGVSFKEVKQVDWSSCDGPSLCDTVVINPTGGAPEPSTWALFGIGFASVGVLALRRRRGMSIA